MTFDHYGGILNADIYFSKDDVMLLFSIGTLITMAVTAILLMLSSFSPTSPEGFILIGASIIFTSLILELNKLHTPFLYAPFWMIGFIPFLYGLYNVEFYYLLGALPVWFVASFLINNARKQQTKESFSVTEKYIEEDGDQLRAEIHENLERREDALKRSKNH
jgi:hypothetical protein